MKPLLIFYSIILITLAISCKKSAGTSSDTALTNEIQLSGNAEVLLVPPTCDGFMPMSWESTDKLKGSWGGVTLYVNSPTYQVYCNNGQTVVLSDGLPFFGSSMGVDNSQNTRVMEPASSSSNSFLIVQGTLSTTDIGKYIDGTQKFRNAWNAFLDTPSKAMPVIDDYVPKGTSGVRNITGKLIRVTSGSNFAIAPSCYPYVLTCTDAPLNVVGKFTHWILDENGLPDYGKIVWVSIDPASTVNGRSTIVAGKFVGSNSTYPGSGTYIASPRSVENFSMNTPSGLITYTGPLNQP